MRYALVLAILPALAGFRGDDPKNHPMLPHTKVAVDFASALVKGDFAAAHALLTPPLREKLTQDELRQQFRDMVALYAPSEPKRIHFDEAFSKADFPGKLPGDLGWVYVGIAGDDFAEAVTVIVTEVEGRGLIREIEWGRPK